ncbi:MAG TPA: hypothetical protein DDW76_27655 [Cyanobacteria bacterium UBA11369]|nr:hypothetical protein [Cyanobacteria bacterium UBA11371]HBE30762.1 hypothetical protein [Cyanobacteria bacterium UBA11368]HBE52444.1 hypothetical protein [Cyanobacteria bacterium UBA11369]
MRTSENGIQILFASRCELFRFMESFDNSDAPVARAINLLQMLPKFDGYDFNPQRVIKVVNYLHLLGYEKSLKILRLYDNFLSTTDSNKLLSVVRILFVFKGRRLIPLILPVPERPFPLTPLHIHRGIPFLLIKGDFLFGEHLSLEHIEAQVQEYELRAAPLIPDDNPLASVDELLESKEMQPKINSDPWKPSMLRLQALNAVSNIYPISEQDKNALLSSSTHEENWKKHRQAFKLLNVFWNRATDEYERGEARLEQN